jgi:hypothetical protein
VVLGERPLPGATMPAISCARNERLVHDLVGRSFNPCAQK